MLHVTSGAIESVINHPSVRAELPGSRGDRAELRFTYQGRTDELIPLSGGSIREQVGFTLLAANPCNLVYVMWRWAPGAPYIQVQEKRNPGMSTSGECRAGGYSQTPPSAVDLINPGTPVVGNTYTMRSELIGRACRVLVDGELVWFGELSIEAAILRGPVGLRTDNCRLSGLEFSE